HAIQRHLLICPSCEERLIGLLPQLGGPFGGTGDALEMYGSLEAVEEIDGFGGRGAVARSGRAGGARKARRERKPVRLPDLSGAISRQGASIEEQRQKAPLLWAELSALPPEIRRARI